MCRGRRRRQSGRRPRSATPSPINVSPKKLLGTPQWGFQPAVAPPLNSVYAEIDSGTAAPCLAGAVGQRFWLEPFNCIMCFVPSARTQAISLVFASPCSGAAVRSAATLPVI